MPPQSILTPLFEEAAARHKHLCPRIVLGVRMGLAGLRHLGMIDDAYTPRFSNKRKHLFTFTEIDGCGADGICTATDCWLVRRTVRHLDYGKMAATLVNRKTEQAVRVTPAADVRERAVACVPEARSRWHAYRDAYALLPDDQLLIVTPVTLTVSLSKIISKPNMRVNCSACGEEVFNEREVVVDGRPLCRPCAAAGYFTVS